MSNEKYLGTAHYQLTGTHYMGNNVKRDIDPETLKIAHKRAEDQQRQYIANLLEKDKDCKAIDNKYLQPCNATVIVLPYDRNPYRVPLSENKSGLILGDFETSTTYKSQETGEQESSVKGIWCCSVVAVGPECKNVIVGDDVYVNFLIANPLPFGGKGYYALSEQNIICSIRLKE